MSTVARDAFVEFASYDRADLRGADFTGSTFRFCSFQHATLDGAELSGARFVHCSFDDASLSGATFSDATTVDCSFRDSAVDGVRDIVTARDLVVELLRRAAGDDQQLIDVVGGVALRRAWCWEHWSAHLRDRPELLDRAAEAFAAYPESGCAEALAGPRR